ncbi:MAG: DUF362 domain-containing protein [candidate division Zixibacteria bacterium]|nr:DUF362 domain-containing protein [candidate division Zixibacteria bacterium]MDH3937384.1 DUF362 domain-containing protein [candidate division Zixibacteria bacterium]
MSQVVVVRHEAGIRGDRLNLAQYKQLVSSGLTTLTNQTSVIAAIQKLLPKGAVGLKTNCLTGKFNSTPVPLVGALADILENAGWQPNDVVVWERTSRELQQAGFELNASNLGRRCLGTDANGVGYGYEFHSAGESSSLISRILESAVTGNINLPVLKDHSIAGLSGGMKNMFGAINNPNKFHGNNCDPHVADVSLMVPIRTRNRLTIINAVQVQYSNGPGYDPGFIAPYGGIVLSDDPVAVDRVGLEIVEHCRREAGLPSLEKANRPARYLQTAQAHGLGTADISKIDLRVQVVNDKGRIQEGKLF